MKFNLIIFFTFLTLSAFGQKDPNEEAQPIVAEGKLLYKSEMASWHGTDLFLEKFKDRESIGGYFAYSENDKSICIFFSKSEDPFVIGTMTFDSTFNLQTATTDLTERAFTSYERDIYEIRKIALAEINSDTLFKLYENTNFNLIPLVGPNEKKVYVLTGPQVSSVVIFGNDYLLTFDQENNLMLKKQLHKNIIPVYYGNEEGEQYEQTMHNHLPATGDLITATDICTIMLYERFAKWKSHTVVSKKYMSMWNCETDQLFILTTNAAEKIVKHSERQDKKKTKIR